MSQSDGGERERIPPRTNRPKKRGNRFFALGTGAVDATRGRQYLLHTTNILDLERS